MYRQEILMFDIHGYTQELIHHIKPCIDDYNIEERDLEFVFDWCIAYSINRLLMVDVHGYVFNLPINDVYRDMYYSTHAIIDSIVLEIFKDKHKIFRHGEKIKLLSTFNTLIIVRSI